MSNDFKRYKCLNCGYVYDEAIGWPDDGFPAGTRWADIPEDWICPECGSEKRDFDMVDW
jgi:rubredoxin